jgi:peroxiredoxin
MRADIVLGGTFPDYELTDHDKARRKLSELQGIDPMILILSRGSYCPKDHQQHLELAANYPKIAVAYTQIVTISTDNTWRPTSSGSRSAQCGRAGVTRPTSAH